MSLKDLPDNLKIKAFDHIVDLYCKDIGLSEWAKDVQTFLMQIKVLSDK